jgi:uncharacterized membrane protein YciS (DUF1049 family)
VIFLIITVLIELLFVLYAIGLGVKDTSVLQYSFQFPGTSWPLTISISPLFQLVPICVIIALGFTWVYLTRRIALRRQEIRKGKVENFPKAKTEKKRLNLGISRVFRSVSRRIGPKLSKAPIKSALIVLLSFLVFAMLFSVLAYPPVIYWAVSGMYQTNPSLSNFVASVNSWARGAAQAVAPIGWVSTAVNNALLTAAPGVRNFGMGFGSLTSPLAALDDAGKYLVLQNAAVCISMLLVLMYSERIRKGYRYKK